MYFRINVCECVLEPCGVHAWVVWRLRQSYHHCNYNGMAYYWPLNYDLLTDRKTLIGLTAAMIIKQDQYLCAGRQRPRAVRLHTICQLNEVDPDGVDQLVLPTRAPWRPKPPTSPTKGYPITSLP